MISPTPYGSLRRRLGLATAAVLLTALFELLRAGSLPSTILTAPTTSATEMVAAPTNSAGPGGGAASGPSVLRGRSNNLRRGSGAATPGPGWGQPFDATSVAASRRVPLPDLRIHPPAPGRYWYRWTVNGQADDGDIVVSTAGGADRDTEVTSGGNSGGQSDTVDWSGGGRVITATTFGNGSSCQWSPPAVSLGPSLAAGVKWQTTSTCRLAQPDSSAITIEQDEQTKVDGLANTTVSGQPVVAWVIERHDLVTERALGASLTSETQSTELFAPSVGLVVYRVGRTATPNPDGSTTITTVIAELRRETPA